MTNSNVFVGDLHGQLWAANKIVDWADDRHMVFCGDLAHKGPNSAGCVALVKGLVEAGRAWCVRGNHDDSMGRGSYTHQEEGITPEEVEWQKSLPLFVRKDGVLALHGGIDKGVAEVIRHMIVKGDLPEEGDWTPDLVKWATGRLSYNEEEALKYIMYTRYIDAEGYMLHPEKQRFGSDEFWALNYNGEFGHVVFGHHPWTHVAKFSHATGIDTGAGETNRLSYGRIPPSSAGVSEVIEHPRGVFGQEFIGTERGRCCVAQTRSPMSLREELAVCLWSGYEEDWHVLQEEVVRLKLEGVTFKPTTTELLDKLTERYG